MIYLPDIPFELTPDRLARAADVGLEEAAAFLDSEAGRSIQPAAVFDEVDPAVLPGLRPAGAPDWGATVLAGLCATGGSTADSRLMQAARRLALLDALDFLEYRVRQYLKPSGLAPGPRLIPGCDDLPLAANRAIRDHFASSHDLGLSVLPSGEIDPAAGLAFIYPTNQGLPASQGKCASCRRDDCPARLQDPSEPAS